MKSAQVRDTFIQYFAKNQHTPVKSSSLIPENDPTLLFTNAGMNQFKNVFLGLEPRDYTRAVSAQKCVRAGGKHNDLDNVGFTARHHTFFEMLGNFSFGDYFKNEAIHFAWELLTKEYQIPKDKLYITVFRDDDEAAEIWHRQESVPKDRIFRFGEKDNFWRMAETGPCGPCTEIFYDHGPHAGKESDPYKGIASGEDRFIEIWNLVFMQFFEKSPGVLEPLPKPSVDTGAGLERLVSALQGQTINYNTDLFLPMIERACKISGADYLQNPVPLRVLADHCRSVGFLIGDGALPSNEGRGYVLRRILRRAVRFGQKISPHKSVLPEMTEVMIQVMGDFYPELAQRKSHILSTIREEQERFLQTLEHGNEILNQEILSLKAKGQKVIPGSVVFKLYDTFGFPADLTQLIAQEQGLKIDEASFQSEMSQAREKAKSSWKGKTLEGLEAHLISWTQDVRNKSGPTEFCGYERLQVKTTITQLSDGSKAIKHLSVEQKSPQGTGQEAYMILPLTAFYAESGGQVGDQGFFRTEAGHGRILETRKISEVFVHHIELLSGQLTIGESIQIEVDNPLRRRTRAHHSATHLLHSALREVLGPHVTQAGSLVDANKTRFDFTHNKPLSEKETTEIERIVNEQIAMAHAVSANLMPYKAAVDSGAMALFGEKYGEEVRVIRMGNYSCELCGGTHVQSTSEILAFKIVSEGGVSSGVRRIEALAGEAAMDYFKRNTQENQLSRSLAGIQESWTTYMENDFALPNWVSAKLSEIKALEKVIKDLKRGHVDVESLLKLAKELEAPGGTRAKILITEVDETDRGILAEISDQLKNRLGTGAGVLRGGKMEDGTAPLLVFVTPNLTSKWAAGNILKLVTAITGGKGGGRPDFAQGSVQSLNYWEEVKTKLTSQLTQK